MFDPYIKICSIVVFFCFVLFFLFFFFSFFKIFPVICYFVDIATIVLTGFHTFEQLSVRTTHSCENWPDGIGGDIEC